MVFKTSIIELEASFITASRCFSGNYRVIHNSRPGVIFYKQKEFFEHDFM
jgi:hypothetical protein